MVPMIARHFTPASSRVPSHDPPATPTRTHLLINWLAPNRGPRAPKESPCPAYGPGRTLADSRHAFGTKDHAGMPKALWRSKVVISKLRPNSLARRQERSSSARLERDCPGCWQVDEHR